MIIPDQKPKLHCNSCLGIRKHSILFETEKNYSDEGEYDTYEEACKYSLVECDGCEDISLHTEWRNNVNPESEHSQWPPKISRKPPKWLVDLFLAENIGNPYKREFLGEIYIALKNNCLRLAVIGIRALLEQIMIESVGDQKTFNKNLEKFEADGYISKLQREAITPVIEAGHASMHRGFKANKDDVEALIDVLENVIESIYISKKKMADLKIPARK